MAEWVAGHRLEDVPQIAIERAKASIIDTVGCMLAGVDEPVTHIAAKFISETRSAEVSSQLGTSLRTSVDAAAFLNGTSGHALDYDDVSATMVGHPSAVAVGAALATAESLRASGRAFLDAYIIGVEVMTALGRAMGPEHYQRGWHATKTLGALGATAAAAKLMGLSAEQVSHALAIAASSASGSRQNFGTMVKPLHVGQAAQIGVTAARLAQLGMLGAAGILEGPVGFYALFAFGESQPEVIATSLGDPYDLEATGFSLKKYPCCFAVHRAVDAVLEIRSEHRLNPAQVRRIVVRAPNGGLAPLIYKDPRTSLEAKFSMEFAVASAVLDGEVTLASFTDSKVARPEVRELLQRVDVDTYGSTSDFMNPIEDGFVDVVLTRQDGKVLSQRCEHPTGSPTRPLSAVEISKKFRSCSADLFSADHADRALDRLMVLEEEADIRMLVGALTVDENSPHIGHSSER